jgi:hypothetical protein
MKKFFVATALALFATNAVAQTPNLDREQREVERFLQTEKIPNVVIRDIYQMGYWYTVAQVCGPEYATVADADHLSEMNYGTAARSLGVPKAIWTSRIALMNAKLKGALMAHADEATVFCQHHKELR